MSVFKLFNVFFFFMQKTRKPKILMLSLLLRVRVRTFIIAKIHPSLVHRMIVINTKLVWKTYGLKLFSGLFSSIWRSRRQPREGRRRRRTRSSSFEVQREEKDKIVLEEDKVRSQETQCREEAKNERPICQEDTLLCAFFSQLPRQHQVICRLYQNSSIVVANLEWS